MYLVAKQKRILGCWKWGPTKHTPLLS